MLRVTIDLLPFGDESRKRTLNVLEIENVGGDADFGNYSAKLFTGDIRDAYQSGALIAFRRARGAVQLVFELLKVMT